MRQFVLHIESPDGERTIVIDGEITIGRTPQSNIAIGDTGLSRRNTTFFIDGDDLLVVDETSLNGTFVNGEKLSGGPQVVSTGDSISIGSSTRISVEISGLEAGLPIAGNDNPDPSPRVPPNVPKGTKRDFPPILIAACLMILVIVFGSLIAILLVNRGSGSGGGNTGRSTAQVSASKVIPMRVIDPLGGEDEDDLDDLIASWETEEKEINAANVSDVTVSSSDKEEADLNVTAAFLADRQAKSLEPRNAETGIRPAGLDVPKELYGDGVIKQKAKLKEMNTTGYHQPMDFADLAEKRLKHELIEMPMASNSFYLAVGGSAGDGAFESFSFKDGKSEIAQDSAKYHALQQLASNYSGQKYDLNNPNDRKQMRMRLLRMFNQRAKPILEEVANAYFQKFNRPLRVTSLTRSMDYQIGLNATNANSFKVRGEGSLPPHTSGCAFDLARRHMTAEEQNFVMRKLAEMEDANKLDALIEYGTNACFHVFIYSDGIPPKI